MAKTGSFSCSNELLNSIQKATEWSFINNYHGYPTDCPHREKNGWTGDAQLASDMALYSYDVVNSYDKWVNDIVDSQLASGMVSAIVPTGGWGYYWGNGPAWDHALLILPWKSYIYTGNKEMLEKYYPFMKKYIEFLSGTAEDFIVRWGLGDWVPVRATTPPELITTAYYYHNVIIMSKIAGVLGKNIDVNRYASLAANIKSAFEKEFVDKSNYIVGNGTQTALSCPLFFNMLDADLAYEVLNNLVENIENNDLNLDFGVLGSKFVPNTLAEMGKIEVAYDMINTTDFPGWGHWISLGATSLWEDWKGESSRNHVFFGDVSAWFYKYLGGIRPVEENPGYKHFKVKPYFLDDLSWVRSSTMSSFGRIESNWDREEDGITMDINIPFNTSATIILPENITYRVLFENKNQISTNEIPNYGNNIAFTLASGNYQIKLGL
jgi:alpha-L-rhamnosidase